MTPDAKNRRVARRLRYLPILIGICFIALAFVWTSRIASNQSESVTEQVRACERGNVLRRHIALLEGIVSVELPDDLEIIKEFPCESLR